jgi:cellulose synthase/poly-beta-1,6-N-acetylglucosamine synthase-like glycosyltransferase
LEHDGKKGLIFRSRISTGGAMTELMTAKYLPSPWATAVQLQYLKYWAKLAGAFRGLNQFRSFEQAVRISYFVVLMVLGVYGLHRLWMVYNCFRHRHNIPAPPPPVDKWPRVTVQLPIYNERYVIERLVDAVARFDYPRELMEIQVLDDSTDETQEVARACVKRHQARGLPIRYLHRDDRTGFKAGALEAGLQSATGEFVAIFDADFLPTPDFLRRTLPYFTDPKTAVVQARWTYLNRGYSILTEVETLMQDGHFVVEQGARSRSGAFFNFNGTAGVWRRAAIDDSGGWQHDTLTEDTDLSYRAQLRGWRFLYLQDIECLSELPVEMNAFKAQQARWSKGLIQTAKKILPRLLVSDASLRVKAEAFFHLTGAICSPFMVVFSALLLPAAMVRMEQGRFQSTLINLLGVASSIAIVAFCVVSQSALYPRVRKRSCLYLLLMVSLGMGISLSNAKAVLEALLGVKSDFVRTSKFNISGSSGSWHGKKYRNRAGWLPYLEIAFGLYFAFLFYFMIRNHNYRPAPFLLLFVLGFVYVGVMSVAQHWCERLWQGKRRTLPGEVDSSTQLFPRQPGESGGLAYLDSAPAVEGSGETIGI